MAAAEIHLREFCQLCFTEFTVVQCWLFSAQKYCVASSVFEAEQGEQCEQGGDREVKREKRRLVVFIRLHREKCENTEIKRKV